MKKYNKFLIFSVLFVSLFSFSSVSGETLINKETGGLEKETSFNIEEQETETTIYLFDDRLCPVCRDTKNYIESIKDDFNLNLVVYSITDTQKLKEIAEKYGVTEYNIMAPTLFINDNFFQFRDFTYRNEEIILAAIKGELINDDDFVIKIPFLETEVDIKNWSLPMVAVVLGSIDGFNVCSIGALILVLSIVMALNSRKQIFFYGGLFIFVSVAVYGSLIFVWGKLFEILIGQLDFLRIIVGLAALGGGIYFFKQFYRFYKFGPTCESSNSKIASKAIMKLQKSFNDPRKKFSLLFSSVVFFAVVITLVELPCSVGIPLAFAGILVESGVSSASYIFYILMYLFFYMLIEMVIFVGAVMTKKIWFANSKMVTWVTFLGAMVLFYLAYYYLV